MASIILITGAAGFAGSHLIELLAHSRHNIVAWHRPGGRPPAEASGIVWEAVDVLDRPAVRRGIDRVRPKAVYHCAGAAHVGRAWDATESTLAINVRGTHHLLEALRESAVDARLLIPSSALIYQPTREPITEDYPLVPNSPYGFSKLAQELLAQRASSAQLEITIGRAFNHVGPRQDPSFAASGFARQIVQIEAGLRDDEVVVGNLDARRDTIDVRDTVRAYRDILERGRPGRPYNISSGHAVAIGEILDKLRSLAKVSVRVRVDPGRFRPSDVPTLVGDSTLLHTELGWAPVIPLSQTLEDLIEYWRSQIHGTRARNAPVIAQS
jgi:GDP-4-dehydro-6-deoxy-D-mannose reductase